VPYGLALIESMASLQQLLVLDRRTGDAISSIAGRLTTIIIGLGVNDNRSTISTK